MQGICFMLEVSFKATNVLKCSFFFFFLTLIRFLSIEFYCDWIISRRATGLSFMSKAITFYKVYKYISHLTDSVGVMRSCSDVSRCCSRELIGSSVLKRVWVCPKVIQTNWNGMQRNEAEIKFSLIELKNSFARRKLNVHFECSRLSIFKRMRINFG